MKNAREISIHALREEGDINIPAGSYAAGKFLSTPSARRATRVVAPPPLRGVPDISIHALREEGDTRLLVAIQYLLTFLSTPSARRATPPVAFVGFPQ